MTDSERVFNYQKLFGSKLGKVVLDDLKEIVMHGKALFDAQPNRLYFLEGRRSIIADVIETIEVDDKTYAKMKEAEAEAKAKENSEDSYDPRKQ